MRLKRKLKIVEYDGTNIISSSNNAWPKYAYTVHATSNVTFFHDDDLCGAVSNFLDNRWIKSQEGVVETARGYPQCPCSIPILRLLMEDCFNIMGKIITHVDGRRYAGICGWPAGNNHCPPA